MRLVLIENGRTLQVRRQSTRGTPGRSAGHLLQWADFCGCLRPSTGVLVKSTCLLFHSTFRLVSSNSARGLTTGYKMDLQILVDEDKDPDKIDLSEYVESNSWKIIKAPAEKRGSALHVLPGTFCGPGLHLGVPEEGDVLQLHPHPSLHPPHIHHACALLDPRPNLLQNLC